MSIFRNKKFVILGGLTLAAIFAVLYLSLGSQFFKGAFIFSSDSNKEPALSVTKITNLAENTGDDVKFTLNDLSDTDIYWGDPDSDKDTEVSLFEGQQPITLDPRIPHKFQIEDKNFQRDQDTEVLAVMVEESEYKKLIGDNDLILDDCVEEDNNDNLENCSESIQNILLSASLVRGFILNVDNPSHELIIPDYKTLTSTGNRVELEADYNLSEAALSFNKNLNIDTPKVLLILANRDNILRDSLIASILAPIENGDNGNGDNGNGDNGNGDNGNGDNGNGDNGNGDNGNGDNGNGDNGNGDNGNGDNGNGDNEPPIIKDLNFSIPDIGQGPRLNVDDLLQDRIFSDGLVRDHIHRGDGLVGEDDPNFNGLNWGDNTQSSEDNQNSNNQGSAPQTEQENIIVKAVFDRPKISKKFNDTRTVTNDKWDGQPPLLEDTTPLQTIIPEIRVRNGTSPNNFLSGNIILQADEDDVQSAVDNLQFEVYAIQLNFEEEGVIDDATEVRYDNIPPENSSLQFALKTVNQENKISIEDIVLRDYSEEFADDFLAAFDANLRSVQDLLLRLIPEGEDEISPEEAFEEGVNDLTEQFKEFFEESNVSMFRNQAPLQLKTSELKSLILASNHSGNLTYTALNAGVSLDKMFEYTITNSMQAVFNTLNPLFQDLIEEGLDEDDIDEDFLKAAVSGMLRNLLNDSLLPIISSTNFQALSFVPKVGAGVDQFMLNTKAPTIKSNLLRIADQILGVDLEHPTELLEMLNPLSFTTYNGNSDEGVLIIHTSFPIGTDPETNELLTSYQFYFLEYKIVDGDLDPADEVEDPIDEVEDPVDDDDNNGNNNGGNNNGGNNNGGNNNGGNNNGGNNNGGSSGGAVSRPPSIISSGSRRCFIDFTPKEGELLSNAVMFGAENDIISGKDISDNRCKLLDIGAPLLRIELSKIISVLNTRQKPSLSRVAWIPSDQNFIFRDLRLASPENAWQRDVVKRNYIEKIFVGDKNNNYRPTDVPTYAEFMKVVLLVTGNATEAELDIDGYIARNIPWYTGVMQKVETLGLTKINPDVQIRRRDAILLIYELQVKRLFPKKLLLVE